MRKAYCDNGPHCVRVDSFGTVRRVAREGEKVQRNQINRSELLCTVGNTALSITNVHLEHQCQPQKDLSVVAVAVANIVLLVSISLVLSYPLSWIHVLVLMVFE